MTIEWIAQPTPVEQQGFLEKHQELLKPVTEKILQLLLTIFDDQQEAFQRMTKMSEDRLEEQFQKYKRVLVLIATNAGAEDFLTEGSDICRASLKALEMIQAKGGSVEAIRTTYVDLFGGFALDMPHWLEKSLLHLVERLEESPQLARQE